MKKNIITIISAAFALVVVAALIFAVASGSFISPKIKAESAIEKLPSVDKITAADKDAYEQASKAVQEAAKDQVRTGDIKGFSSLKAVGQRLSDLEQKLDVVDSTQVMKVLPGTYIARVVLKYGVPADTITAKLGGKDMTLGVDAVTSQDILYIQVNDDKGLSAVLTDTKGRTQTVEIK